MEIKIRKSAPVCAACEQPFQHGQAVHSLLGIAGGEQVRTDWCGGCWNRERTGTAYCHWQFAYDDPKVSAAEVEETLSPMRTVFYKAVEREERLELAIAYLAAHLLRRQKAFRLVKESDEPEGESKLTIFADRIGNRLVEVRDPALTHLELQEGRAKLMERLAELEQPDTGEQAGEPGTEVAAHAKV